MQKKNRTMQTREGRKAEVDLHQRLNDERAAAREKRQSKQERIQQIKQGRLEKHKRKMRTEVPILYLGPLVPALLSVITICLCGVTTNVGANCQGTLLRLYLSLSQGLAYFFMFGFACMFIGGDCIGPWALCECELRCTKFKQIQIFYGFTAAVAVAINSIGLVAFLGAGQCSGSAPLTYGVAGWQVLTFWATFLSAVSFAIRRFLKGRASKKKVLVTDSQFDDEEEGSGEEDEVDADDY